MSFALQFSAPGKVRVLPQLRPAPGSSEILARAICSGISWGSESRILKSGAGTSQDSFVTREAQKAEASGPFPLSYGYCHVALIGESGKKTDLQPGQRIFSFSPHHTYVTPDPEACYLLPRELPDERATLLANMETALSLLMDAGNITAKRVLIAGMGVVGQLCYTLLRSMPLQNLQAVDTSSNRRCLTEFVHGFSCLADWEETELNPPPQVIFELSGNPASLNQAIRCAALNATIVAGSWYPDDHLRDFPATLFHKKRIRLISSQVSHMPADALAFVSKKDRINLAVRLLLHNPGLDRLITHRVHICEAADLYKEMLEQPANFGQCILQYP